MALFFFTETLNECGDYVADYLQRQGDPQKDREADSPLADCGPWSSHSYPLWYQTPSVYGHMNLRSTTSIISHTKTDQTHPS